MKNSFVQILQSTKLLRQVLLTIAFIFILFAVNSIADEERNESVKFAPGTSSTTVKDSITGYNTVNYKIGAKAGQQMAVELNTDNTATYFNIFVPGKDRATRRCLLAP